MWLLEECRREWARQGTETSYGELVGAAEEAEPFRSVINVNDSGFIAPGGMPQRIVDHCLASRSARAGDARSVCALYL